MTRKTLIKLFREDNFLSLAGNVAIAFFGFAGFALLARSFPVKVFGEWVLFIASGTFIEMFRFGITNTAIIRYLAGSDDGERNRYIGSNALIGIVSTLGISLLLFVSGLLFAHPVSKAGYALFFTYYPLLAILNLPYNSALVILQADQKFGKIFLIKLLNGGGFFLLILLNNLFLHMSLTGLVWCNIAVTASASLVCIILGWDGLRLLGKASRETTRTLLHFGKYTTFTLIGTNLLRSADTLIISLSPLGTAAVALYSIPLKLTEIQQIPLRSFAATAFPKMARASIQKNLHTVRELFYVYSGAMTYLFVFISMVTFVFAEFFVLLLGGHQYLGIDPVTGFNTVTLVRIFSLYGLLLPIDRMTGIGLDSINKPGMNAIKVFIMVVFNVAGDLIGVFIFKSLPVVALSSILFTLIGVWIGMTFFNREVGLQFNRIFTDGILFYREMISRFHLKEKPSGYSDQ